jgi:hypothetical protein
MSDDQKSNSTRLVNEEDIIREIREVMASQMPVREYKQSINTVLANFAAYNSTHRVVMPKPGFTKVTANRASLGDFCMDQMNIDDLMEHLNKEFGVSLEKGLPEEMTIGDIFRFTTYYLKDRFVPLYPEKQQGTDGNTQQGTTPPDDFIGQFGHTPDEPRMDGPNIQSTASPIDHGPKQFGNSDATVDQQSSGTFRIEPRAKPVAKGLPGPAAQRNSSGNGQGQVQG